MSHVNIIQCLYKHAEKNPDKIIYTLLQRDMSEINTTYSELLNMMKTFANGLNKKGVKPTDRVVLALNTGIDFIVAFLGCLLARVIAVPAFAPLNTAHSQRLNLIIKDAEPKLVVTDANIQLEIEKNLMLTARNHLTSYCSFASILHTEKSTNTKLHSPLITTEKIAFLQYTSGTTADPKGIMVSHGNILANEEAIKKHTPASANSVAVNWLPHYHDMGLIGAILQPIYVGFRSVLMSPIDFLKRPNNWLKAISKYQADRTAAPNFAYALCCKRAEKIETPLDLSHWAVAFTGSEPVSHLVLQNFYQCFKKYGFKYAAFTPCYGLAESTLMVTCKEKDTEPALKSINLSSLKHVKPEQHLTEDSTMLVSAGYSHEEVLIVNPYTKQACDNNEIGEIWLHGPSVAQGYWHKPQLTQEIFNNKLANANNDKRYLRTGDLGFLSNGQLYIAGRLKDMIIIDGQNFYPQDIEQIITNTFPEIRAPNIAAFSLENTDTKVCIVAEMHPQYTHVNFAKLSLAIKQAVHKQLGLVIHHICLIKPKGIPKTTSGKISRTTAKNKYVSNQFAVLHES